MFSPAEHCKSPHTGPLPPQSLLQLDWVSPLSHLPLPHTDLQSVGQVELLSPLSQAPLPQTGPVVPQSLEQLVLVSPDSHLPLPQTGPLELAGGAPQAVNVEPQAL